MLERLSTKEQATEGTDRKRDGGEGPSRDSGAGGSALNMACTDAPEPQLPPLQGIDLASDCRPRDEIPVFQFSVSSSSSFCFFLSASHRWIFSLSSVFGLIWSMVRGLRLKGSV